MLEAFSQRFIAYIYIYIHIQCRIEEVGNNATVLQEKGLLQ